VRQIRIVPYDSRWPDQFGEEANELAAIFGQEFAAIHHIGSTAVPGLWAKPIIDVLVEVRDVETLDGFDQKMTERGCVPKGEFGIPGRRFFIGGNEERRTHHIHMFEVGGPEPERHLNFRDYLIAHSEEARVYGRLKQELAREFRHDIESYAAGKEAFIKEVERKAVLWTRRRRAPGSS
jgi:GrpB-like predicted nucleotidyltransferase (UPF0157 family)